MIFHPNLEYDVSSKSKSTIFHPNLKYDVSSKSRSGSYPDLGMDDHQNLEYDFSSKSRVWMIIKI